MAGNKDLLLGLIRDGRHISRGQRVQLTLLLCGPAILAQLEKLEAALSKEEPGLEEEV